MSTYWHICKFFDICDQQFGEFALVSCISGMKFLNCRLDVRCQSLRRNILHCLVVQVSELVDNVEMCLKYSLFR